MDLRQKFKAFRELIDENFYAVHDMFNLVPDSKRVNPEIHFYDAIDHTRRMIELYKAVSGSQEEAKKLLGKLEQARKAGNIAAALNLAHKLDYNQDPQEAMLSGTPNLAQVYQRQLFDAVLNITKPIRDFTSPEFKAENTSTLHDIIRYVHQRAIDEMFDSKKQEHKEKRREIKLDGVKIKVLDINKTNKRHGNKYISCVNNMTTQNYSIETSLTLD